MKGSLTHPGEILLKEFLKPMGISQDRIAEGRQTTLDILYDFGE